MQVPVQQPPDGPLQLALAVVLAGALAGIPAQQVMEAEPPGCARLQQVRAGQPLQHPPDRPGRHPSKGGGGLGGELWARDQAQQPKQPLRLDLQDGIRGVERAADCGVRIPVHRQLHQPIAYTQPVQVAADWLVGLAGQVGRGDPQRQRQIPAHRGKLRGRLGLGSHAVLAEELCQQADRLTWGEHVQGQPAGAVAGDQPAEPVAAGHHHQAAGRTRDERSDLAGVAGVVQHHQHPPVRQQRPVQPGGLLDLDRHLLGRHAQRAQ
jgi:hypothetical protein